MATSRQPEPRPVDLGNAEARKTAAAMLMRLFDHWRLGTADQLMLLGLDEDSRATLSRYRSGQSAIENRTDTLDRVAMLFEIHALLRTIFPDNREYVYGWMTARQRQFGNLTPVELVREHRYLGLSMLVRHLEHLRGT